MPIEFLNDRNRINRVGRIRLGHKVKTANGGERPTADPFFNVPDELKQFYGDKPTTMRIRFISDDLETTFPHYLRWYTKSCLRCLGDGQHVIYQIDDKGVKAVSNYCALDAEGKVVMNGNGPKRVACEGEACPHYESGECKPTGYLRFVVEEHLRQGYYDVVCHQRAVVGIRTQLELCLRMFGRIVDIPFLLHRGDAEKVAVKTIKGIVDMPVRTQWIEIDPEWFGKAFMDRRRELQSSREMLLLEAKTAADELYGTTDTSQAAKVPALAESVADFAEPNFEGENGDAEPEYDTVDATATVVKSEETPEYATIDPATVRTRLLQRSTKFSKGAKTTDGQRGLLVGKLCEALQTNDERIRHLVLKWIWGRESTKDLAYGEIGAMLEWLLDSQDSTGDYPWKADGLRELLAIEHVARLDAGQLVMAEVDA